MHLAVWVLMLVTPGNLPDIPISPPVLTIEECHEREAQARGQAPFPVVCVTEYLAWENLI